MVLFVVFLCVQTFGGLICLTPDVRVIPPVPACLADFVLMDAMC